MGIIYNITSTLAAQATQIPKCSVTSIASVASRVAKPSCPPCCCCRLRFTFTCVWAMLKMFWTESIQKHYVTFNACYVLLRFLLAPKDCKRNVAGMIKKKTPCRATSQGLYDGRPGEGLAGNCLVLIWETGRRLIVWSLGKPQIAKVMAMVARLTD